MFLHIGAFVAATLIETLELASFLMLYKRSIFDINDKWWLHYILIESEIYAIGFFFSGVPLLLILNSLIDKGIAEKTEQNLLNIPDNTSQRTSINMMDTSRLTKSANGHQDEI